MCVRAEILLALLNLGYMGNNQRHYLIQPTILFRGYLH